MLLMLLPRLPASRCLTGTSRLHGTKTHHGLHRLLMMKRRWRVDKRLLRSLLLLLAQLRLLLLWLTIAPTTKLCGCSPCGTSTIGATTLTVDVGTVGFAFAFAGICAFAAVIAFSFAFVQGFPIELLLLSLP